MSYSINNNNYTFGYTIFSTKQQNQLKNNLTENLIHATSYNTKNNNEILESFEISKVFNCDYINKQNKKTRQSSGLLGHFDYSRNK